MLKAAFPLAVDDTLSMIRGFIYTMRENKKRKQKFGVHKVLWVIEVSEK